MGVRTRIGLGCLSRDGGSVELPENVTWCCPRCGTLVADKGQCLVMFMEWPQADESGKEQNVLRMTVDCRNCGCIDKEPMNRKTWAFIHKDDLTFKD